MSTLIKSATHTIEGLLPELEAIYKDLHQHPELSMQEVRTAGIAADYVEKLGYDVTRNIGETGVVAMLRNGDGPTVMLRADMGNSYAGQEYLGIYPYVSRDPMQGSSGKDRLWINTSSTCYVVFEKWLEGEEPYERR